MTDTKWNSIKWFFDRLWENPDSLTEGARVPIFIHVRLYFPYKISFTCYGHL